MARAYTVAITQILCESGGAIRTMLYDCTKQLIKLFNYALCAVCVCERFKFSSFHFLSLSTFISENWLSFAFPMHSFVSLFLEPWNRVRSKCDTKNVASENACLCVRERCQNINSNVKCQWKMKTQMQTRWEYLHSPSEFCGILYAIFYAKI